jgi:hypothetical protein
MIYFQIISNWYYTQSIGKVSDCRTMGISDDILRITRATESLEHSLRQKQLTKEQDKLLDHVRIEYERGLDILEECRKISI